MTAAATFSRADFERLLVDYRGVIELANDLEYRVYELGQVPPSDAVTSCQQAAGALIGSLRSFLFQLDMHGFPALDAISTATPQRA